MTGANNTLLYTQVVRVTHVYLGPAADRFIARQVENHLQKPPEDMSKKDLLSLIDWIKVAVSLLTDDSEIVEEYALQLHKLAVPTKPKSKAKAKAKQP
ncbi:MAG: hypothetical protein JWO35_734 [Candidatus Saccharibacteria bacterium]|nr:hypothetical protein [Candidatus Saccharibacteria bacterium]